MARWVLSVPLARTSGRFSRWSIQYPLASSKTSGLLTDGGIERLLSGRAGDVGVTAADNRLFVNAVYWVVKTGAP